MRKSDVILRMKYEYEGYVAKKTYSSGMYGQTFIYLFIYLKMYSSIYFIIYWLVIVTNICIEWKGIECFLELAWAQ